MTPRGNWIEEDDGSWSLYDAHHNQLAWVVDDSQEGHRWITLPDWKFSFLYYPTKEAAILAIERCILEDAQRNYNAMMSEVLAIGATLEEVQD